ncbi:MAG TPA: alpha/beta fold hydrolase [Thermoleophilaceae bacterium]
MTRTPRHPGLHDAKGRELEHQLLDVDGVATYTVDAGEGSPILFVHGYGDTADGWRRVVPGLLETNRVIAIDVPPFGRSGRISERELFDFYAGYFPALLDRLEIKSATLVGHSLGGAIALRFALANPKRVARLGLVAPAGLGKKPPWWWRPIAGNGVAWRAALAIPSPLTPLIIREGMSRFLDLRLFHDSRALRQDIRHLVDLHSTTKDFGALLEAGRACIASYTGTLLEDSKAITCPKFMVWGRHDGLVPVSEGLAFQQAHPDADVHILERCGHYPQIEMPGRFNRLLRAWIADTAGACDKPLTRRTVEAA